MKILVVGKKQIMHWPENVAHFLPKEYQVETFFYNRRNFFSIFHKFFFKKKRYQKCAQRLKKQIQRFQPDLILYISSFFIPLECYKILKDFPKLPRVGWVSDAFGTDQKKKADYLDILFCSDTGYLKATKDFTCESLYLPLCADETVFVNRHLPRLCPPFFAGVANPIRNKYLKAVQSKCLIYGSRWPKKEMPQHEVHNYKLQHKKMQDFINKTVAPINLTFSPNIISGLNFRVFEIACCGGLILVNDMPDLHLCYQVGKEAVVYRTPEDLNSLVKDIAKNPQKYEAIAQAGYERTMREHTYSKRLEQMMKIIKDKKVI